MELNVVVVSKNFTAMDNYKDTFNVQNTAVAVGIFVPPVPGIGSATNDTL